MGGVFDHYSHKLHTSPLNLFDVFVNVSFFFVLFFCITELKSFTLNDTCACGLACFSYLENQHMPKKNAGIVMHRHLCFLLKYTIWTKILGYTS